MAPSAREGRLGPATRKWALPALVAVAILVVLIVFWGGSKEPADPRTAAWILEWPADAVTADQDAAFQILVYWPDNQTAPPDDVAGMPQGGDLPPGAQTERRFPIKWDLERVGLLNITLEGKAIHFGDKAVTEAPPGARFGVDGHNATRVIFYAWSSDQEVIATNAPLHELNRFPVKDDYAQMPAEAWYLGDNETAPEGTRKLPREFEDLGREARDLLQGTPVGGVASAKLPEEDYGLGWLLGDLWLTVQVQELLRAP